MVNTLPCPCCVICDVHLPHQCPSSAGIQMCNQVWSALSDSYELHRQAAPQAVPHAQPMHETASQHILKLAIHLPVQPVHTTMKSSWLVMRLSSSTAQCSVGGTSQLLCECITNTRRVTHHYIPLDGWTLDRVSKPGLHCNCTWE